MNNPLDNLYNKHFLETTIEILNDQLNDLANWSVYNNDKNLDEIHDFQKRFNELAEELKKI